MRLALCILLAAVPAIAAESDRSLSFAADGAAWKFDTGAWRGALRREGKALGLGPLVHIPTGTGIAGPYGVFSQYRLLDTTSRYGPAAWDWASTAKLLPDGTVEVSWSTDEVHPFDMKTVYRWSAPDTLDLSTTVTARKDLRGFEVFLASYLAPMSIAHVYAKGPAGPAFVQATKADGDWQAFPRDEAAAGLVKDGRWNRPPNPVDWKMRAALAAPLAMRRDPKTGLVAVLMAPAADCFAVCTPFGEESHRSLYFSLLGVDLKPNESATARARLVLGKDITPEQAIALYRKYVQEK